MARFPAFTTSLAVHAFAVSAVVLAPFVPDSLPEVAGPPPPQHFWPMGPQVVLADARPAPSSRPTARPRGGASPVPAGDTQEPVAPPTHVSEVAPTTLDSEAEIGKGPSGASGGDGIASATQGLSSVGGHESTQADGRATGEEPVRVGCNIRPPAKRRHVQPDYPELARRAGVSGTVVIDCRIDTNGDVADVRVMSGHPLLTGAAVEAVRQWRYAPTQLDGVPVAVLMTVTVQFNLVR